MLLEPEHRRLGSPWARPRQPQAVQAAQTVGGRKSHLLRQRGPGEGKEGIAFKFCFGSTLGFSPLLHSPVEQLALYGKGEA